MFTITVTEINSTPEASNVIRYQQTVDGIDLRKIINAVNDAAQPQRQRRSDAGKPKTRLPGGLLDDPIPPKKTADDEFFK